MDFKEQPIRSYPFKNNRLLVIAKFDVVDKENLKLRCHYCEKFTTKETMKFTE
mgnify:CR=1 FL=1